MTMPDVGQLTLDHHPIGKGWRLVLGGELDLATAPVLEERLRELQDTAVRVVVDLRELSFMDCSGLGVLVAAQRHARRVHARVEVVCAAGPVQRLLTMTGIDQLLEFAEPSAGGDGGGGETGGRSRVPVDQTGAGVAVFTPEGPVDTDTVSDLHDQVRDAVVDGHRRVIVDLLAVPALSAEIPGALGAALRAASSGAARFGVVTTDLRLQDALVLSGIAGLELHPTLTTAVASLDLTAIQPRRSGRRAGPTAAVQPPSRIAASPGCSAVMT